jgi:hypothetical protein
MLEYGKASPVGPYDSAIIANHRYYPLLGQLFQGKDVRKYQKELELMDRYLDIPLVEAYFNRHSYKAFRRLVDNQCTKFPSYDHVVMDDIIDVQGNSFCDDKGNCISFCDNAAMEGRLDVLQKALELGFPPTTQTLVHLCAKDIPSQTCEAVTSSCEAIKLILCKAPHLQFNYSCLYNAVSRDDLDMVQLICNQSDILSLRGNGVMRPSGNIHEMNLGQVIRSVKMFLYLVNHRNGSGIILTIQDVQSMMQSGRLDLIKAVLDTHVDLEYEAKWFFNTDSLELITLVFETIHWTEKERNEFIHHFAHHKQILRFLLTYRYIDQNGFVSTTFVPIA